MFARKTVEHLLAGVHPQFGLVLCLLALGLLAAPTPSAHAATITVTSAADGAVNALNCPSPSSCRLRDAIARANPGDAITFGVACCNALTQGQFVINKDLTISANAACDVTIDANNASRAFDITGGTVNLSGLCIINGAPGHGNSGGAIRVGSGGTLNLSNVIIQNNKASGLPGNGGAIFNAGVLNITNFAFFSGNSASTVAAGIYNTGAATLAGTIASNGSRSVWFFSNQATSDGGTIYNTGTMTVTNTAINLSSGDVGGAIFSSGTMSLDHSLISSNTGRWGGGIVNGAGGTLTITDSTIAENTGTDQSGGIDNNGTLTIHRSTISGNGNNGASGGGVGGGISNENMLTLINVTLSGNLARTDGGGLYNTGTANLNNVTLTDNTADSDANGTGNGGGIFNSGTVNLKNTIIAGNTDSSAGTKHPDCSGTLNSQGYNLLRVNSGCTGLTDLVNGDLVGTSGTPKNAFLGALADNGGPTQTHALNPASPAIDAGNPAVPGSGGDACALHDQRDYLRGGAAGRCDIGAYERVFLLYLPMVER